MWTLQLYYTVVGNFTMARFEGPPNGQSRGLESPSGPRTSNEAFHVV